MITGYLKAPLTSFEAQPTSLGRDNEVAVHMKSAPLPSRALIRAVLKVYDRCLHVNLVIS